MDRFGFGHLLRVFYKEASGVALVYDMHRRHTFDRLQFWLDEMKKINNPFATILIATKLDLDDGRGSREVRTEEGEAMAKKLGIPFFEVSSKTGQGVREAFTKLVDNIFAQVVGVLPEPTRRPDEDTWNRLLEIHRRRKQRESEDKKQQEMEKQLARVQEQERERNGMSWQLLTASCTTQ